MPQKKVKTRKRNYPAHLTRAQARAEERLQRAMNGYIGLMAATPAKYQNGPHKPGKMDHH